MLIETQVVDYYNIMIIAQQQFHVLCMLIHILCMSELTTPFNRIERGNFSSRWKKPTVRGNDKWQKLKGEVKKMKGEGKKLRGRLK